MYNVKFLRLNPQAEKPYKRYHNDAGWDLFVCKDCDVPPGETVDVHTGIALDMPKDIYCRLTGRSSTLRVHNLLVNEGIIDSGFTGELCISVHNVSNTSFHVKCGMRLGQILFHRVEDVRFEETDRIQLEMGSRNTQGYGSTGTDTTVNGEHNG